MLPGIRKILVPLDFSPPSDQALAYARALAADSGASLHVLHVVEDRLLSGPWPNEVYLGELPKLRATLIGDAEERLRECAKLVEAEGVQVTCEVAIGGPTHTIVDAAATSDIDLIVMGTHGRTGLTHLLIGSVAERVIRHAPCPVLVVRERKAADRPGSVAEYSSDSAEGRAAVRPPLATR
jgi:nucleotide-binding universal stress UspA family protein